MEKVEYRQIFSFGENKTNKWYTDENGTRVDCCESQIRHLWFQWAENMTAEKDYIDGYTIFTVSEKPLILPIHD